MHLHYYYGKVLRGCENRIIDFLRSEFEVSTRRVKQICGTVDAICQSSKVVCFRIGYTSRSIQGRAGQYSAPKGGAWMHFVALADKLSQDDALELEKKLFDRIRDEASTKVKKKFDTRCTEAGYRRSSGGKSDDDSKTHSVYIAWTDEHGYVPE